MKSIHAKIILWLLGTFAVSLAVFAVGMYRGRQDDLGPISFLNRTFALIEDEALRAYRDEGPAGLAAYLKRLDAYYGAEHSLTDASGHDLVTGADRSAFLMDFRDSKGPPRRVGGRLVFSRSMGGGAYRLLIVLNRGTGPPNMMAYLGAVGLVITALGYILAVHLVAPLRSLRKVVDQFGRGDLAARANSTRGDEIGELSRAFDQMADQIGTLRSAELRLLQDVSHELRSPLARLGFNLELARMSDDPDTAFARIKRDFERLTSLVEELLELTTAERDPASRPAEMVPLGELALAIVEECIPEVEAKGCWIALNLEPNVDLKGDREQIRRAVENVLRNAIRHAPEGTPIELTLSTREGLAALTIRDHGGGVPEESLQAIFQPFFRVDDDRGRSSGGVGLGLSIVERSVTLHQGRVRADNAHPGLKVTIELPITRTPDQRLLTQPRPD